MKFLAIFPDARLSIDDGAARGERDEERDEHLEWQKDDADDERGCKFPRALQRIVELRGAFDIFKEPGFLEVVERHFPHDGFIKIRQVHDEDAFAKKA